MSTSPPNDESTQRVRPMGGLPQQPNPSASSRRLARRGSLEPDPFVFSSFDERSQPYYEQARDLDVNGMDRFLAFFGLGKLAMQARKSYVVLLWNIVWSIAQIVVIVTMVVLSATVFTYQSPNQSIESELSACDRPLGVWACLWIVRVIVLAALSYWDYLRELEVMEHFVAGAPVLIRTRGRQSTIPHWYGSRQHRPIRQQGTVVPQPNARYTRLSVVSSLITLTWFLTAHILEYTSINTCRHTSPHLWWLVFGILCVMYLIVFQVVFVGFIVLVITPIVFVFWNILLICLGRHPIQNPPNIKPDIEKIPKALVEKIPLVMYIPPPPDGLGFKHTSPKIISNPHTYPPSTSTKPAVKSRPLFKFLKSKSSKMGDVSTTNGKLPADVEKVPGSGQSMTWSDYWEHNDYPFVILPGNRAACAICLLDFEEPKRRAGVQDIFSAEKKEITDGPTVSADERKRKIDQPMEGEGTPNLEVVVEGEAEAGQGSSSDITLEARVGGSSGLQLEDAGEEAQPLRLLTCGHVFHKTCLDPWLTDVSGRCPVCQRPVEISGQKPKVQDRIPNTRS